MCSHLKEVSILFLQWKNAQKTFAVVVQLLSHVWLFLTQGTATHQAPLSFTVSRSLLKFMSIELKMLSNTSHPLQPLSPFAFSLSQHQVLFQWVSFSHQVANSLELYFQHQSSNDKQGQIPLGLIRLGNLAVQGTVKSLPQHHSSKTSILRCSAFFMVQLSHPQEKEMATPAFLPGESHGQRSGAGYSP